MKKCSCCKVEKEESHFQKNASTKDGLQDRCKVCRKITDRKTYLNRTPEQKARFHQFNTQAVQRNVRLMYEYLLQHPCVDCGEPDPVVLEFDHVRGEKRRNVAEWVRSGRSRERVYEEIEKCEVRCANCHRRITAKRFGCSKDSWYTGNGDLPT